jgi:hypothetical protein
MKTIDVLRRVDRRNDSLRLDARRQRQLDEDAVDAFIRVERRH